MKKIFIIVLSLLMFVSLSGFSSTKDTYNSTNIESNVIKTSGKDYRVKINTRDFSSFNLKNVQGVYVEVDFANLPYTFEQLNEYSDYIIKCTVEDVSFAVNEAEPYTILNVRVDESLKGEFKTGDLITISQYGGYMTLQDEVKVYDNTFRFSQKTKEERENTIIQKKCTSEPYPKTNEQFVFFLEKCRIFEGAYTPVCDYYSRYKLNKNGKYKRALSYDYSEARGFNEFKFDDKFRTTIKSIVNKSY